MSESLREIFVQIDGLWHLTSKRYILCYQTFTPSSSLDTTSQTESLVIVANTVANTVALCMCKMSMNGF